MATARESDFLGEGTVDPFSGLAPALSPEEEDRMRRAKLANTTRSTTAINSREGGYFDQRSSADANARFHANPSQVIDAYIHSQRDPSGNFISQQEYEAAKRLQKGNEEAMNTLAYKLATYGILAGPAAITGGAALGGALGFGEGAGTLVAGAGELPMAPAGIPAASAPFTMASPFPAAGAAGASGGGAAGGGAAAGGAAAAGAGWTAGDFAKNVGVPVISALAPLAIDKLAGNSDKENQQLLDMQKQIAHDAEVRRGQAQDARMNMLAQQVLAFNPRNQMLAQMFGPQAAFTPEAMAQMVQGPAPNWDQDLLNYTGNDQERLKAKREMIRRKNEYDAAEAQRQQMIMNGVQAPGPGPAPIQMPAPQPARRY